MYFYSPEILSGNSYSGYKADLWAFGITLYAAYSCELPFFSNNISDLFSLIKTKKIQYPELMPSPLRKLINGLLEVDPSKRWSIKDIKKCEFLNARSATPFLQTRSPGILLSKSDIESAITPLKRTITIEQLNSIIYIIIIQDQI